MSSICLVAACSGVDPGADRTAWLVDCLYEDNLIWMSRDLDLLAAKYDQMEDDPYDFMRGTAGVFLRDVVRPGTTRSPTGFYDPAAPLTLVVGDPHPENFGTFVPVEGANIRIEANDLDAAVFGSWVFDTRRAVVGLIAVAEPLPDCGTRCSTEIVEAFATGYANEIERAWSGLSPIDPTDEALGGAAVSELMATVRLDGETRLRLESLTELVHGERTFVVQPAWDGSDGAMLALTAEEQAQVDRLIAQWERPATLRVLDVARRFGTGVASLPSVRYVVLYDYGDSGLDDDGLLQIREVVDPPVTPGVTSGLASVFEGNGQRVVDAAHWLWSTPLADPWMDWGVDGEQQFKFSSWNSWFQPFNHDDIASDWREGVLVEDDLEALAAYLGGLLAASHARAPTLDGGRAVDVIGPALAGRHAEFVTERVEHGFEDYERMLDDYDRFEDALDAYGPLLGAGEMGR